MTISTTVTLLRRPAVLARLGYGTTSLYLDIGKGLMTPGVPVGADRRLVAWPEHEVNAVNAARVGSASDHQLKILVTRLLALRRELMPDLIADIPPTPDGSEPPPPRPRSKGRPPGKKHAAAPAPEAEAAA